MNQIIVDADGIVTSTFVSNILQAGAIEISDASLWAQISGKVGRVKFRGGGVEPYEPPARPLPPPPDPVERLAAFLAANPDVKALLGM